MRAYVRGCVRACARVFVCVRGGGCVLHVSTVKHGKTHPAMANVA